MPAPVLTPTGQDAYDSLTPLAYADEENGWPLAWFVAALALQFDWIYDLVSDTDDGVGWSPVVDVDRCPAFLLPWLAQFVGIRFVTGRTVQQQRDEITDRPRWRRGTPAAIISLAKEYLTGTKTVYLVERQGSAYRMALTTLSSETPDLPALVAAVTDPYRGQKPTGVVMHAEPIVGGDYQTLRDTHSDYADVTATFTDYDDIVSDPAQQ